jgi:major membrane immunogen (membrane-anchored lipoprotein)
MLQVECKNDHADDEAYARCCKRITPTVSITQIGSYEIANKGWLRQFYSKPYTRFEYRKNVDALSGATFSSQSLVNDVNLILDHLKR